jgi:hypothetical protein
LHRRVEIEKQYFRKESSEKGMQITPTRHYWGQYSRIEDYSLQESIRKTLNKKGRAIFSPAFSV